MEEEEEVEERGVVVEGGGGGRGVFPGKGTGVILVGISFLFLRPAKK